MRNFNVGGSSRFGKRSSGGSRFAPRGGSRDDGRTQMHDAKCAECGKDCKVPFKPSQDRPVYCSDCFEKRGNGNEDRAPRRDFGDSNRSFDRKPRYNSDRGDNRRFDKKDRSQDIIDRLDKVIELLSSKA